MSPEEALILLKLHQEDPLDEQIEFVFFELKQKIYRQLEQVLLYPKWIKELSRLDTAARALGVGFTEKGLSFQMKNHDISDSNDRSMLAQFNAQYQLRSKIAYLIYNGTTPVVLKEILSFWLEQQKDFFQLLWEFNFQSRNSISRCKEQSSMHGAPLVQTTMRKEFIGTPLL